MSTKRFVRVKPSLILQYEIVDVNMKTEAVSIEQRKM